MKRFDQPLGADDEAPAVFWEFRPEQIEQSDFSEFLSRFGDAEKADLPRNSQGSFHIAVAGVDDDPREIPEIPEVRAFYKNFFEAWPHWLFFIETENLRIMTFCILNTFTCVRDENKKHVVLGFEDSEMEAFIEEQTSDFLLLSDHSGIESVEATELLEKIKRQLLPKHTS
jgi:hypothetical protein